MASFGRLFMEEQVLNNRIKTLVLMFLFDFDPFKRQQQQMIGAATVIARFYSQVSPQIIKAERSSFVCPRAVGQAIRQFNECSRDFKST